MSNDRFEEEAKKTALAAVDTAVGFPAASTLVGWFEKFKPDAKLNAEFARAKEEILFEVQDRVHRLEEWKAQTEKPIEKPDFQTQQWIVRRVLEDWQQAHVNEAKDAFINAAVNQLDPGLGSRAVRKQLWEELRELTDVEIHVLVFSQGQRTLILKENVLHAFSRATISSLEETPMEGRWRKREPKPNGPHWVDHRDPLDFSDESIFLSSEAERFTYREALDRLSGGHLFGMKMEFDEQASEPTVKARLLFEIARDRSQPSGVEEAG